MLGFALPPRRAPLRRRGPALLLPKVSGYQLGSGASSSPPSPASPTSLSQPNPAAKPEECFPLLPPTPHRGRQDRDRRIPPPCLGCLGPREPVCRWKSPPEPGKRGEGRGELPCPPSQPALAGRRCAAASGGSAVRGNLTPARPGPWALGHGPGKVRSPCSSNCLVVYFIQVP